MLGSIAIVGIVFSAFQAATNWAIIFSIVLVVVFSWSQGQRLVKASKQRKLQTQDISVAMVRQNISRLSGDGAFAYKISDTKFHERELLGLRAKLNAPFFEPLTVEMLLVSRPLDRLRRNAVQVYVGDAPIGWLEIDRQLALVEVLDGHDGIAQVKGKVAFGLKAESHSASIDLRLED